ncbi:TraR/DksA family transcriptional regulator [Metabacillus sp. 84]|uniref:TraR/DksA family transcriptional regulator n=1 Tax=Metabacillus sp. 84 TaxID=3404705 RepID=UPI003CFBB866
MSNDFFSIRKELELMRKELQERLFHHSMFESDHDGAHNGTILHHVKEELRDVEHALSKMDTGSYGFCEKTGLSLPISSLKYLPTARNVHDFSYLDQYEKKSLPYSPNGNSDYAGEMVYYSRSHS